MADQSARLDHVGLAVADLAGAAAWFCDVFGLVPELALRVEPLELSIQISSSSARLPDRLLAGRPTASGSRTRRLRPGFDGYGHVAFDVTDLDAAYDRAMVRGAQPVCRLARTPEPGNTDGVRRRPGGQPRRAAAPLAAGQAARLGEFSPAVPAYPARGGGPWLWRILVPSGLRAVVVPSGCRVTVQPH